MNDDLRARAATAVMALATRAESSGRKSGAAAKGKGWQPMPFVKDIKMDVGKMREAVGFYGIAEELNPEAAGFGFPRAMLLEAIGDWAAAIAAFAALEGTGYEQHSAGAVERCRAKKAGTFDPAAEAIAALRRAQASGDNSATAMLAMMTAGSAGGAAATAVDPYEQALGDTARRFVNLLLDRDWSGAKAMLHADDPLDAETMEREFTALFEDEDWPPSADVHSIDEEDSTLEDDDLASIYVEVSSLQVEAVILTVCRGDDHFRVRRVEFGRP